MADARRRSHAASGHGARRGRVDLDSAGRRPAISGRPDSAGQGRAVTIAPGKVELTTQEVADYLNVSRPYVVKLIHSGKLPARMVGTHRHVSFADLIRFDEEGHEARRAALDERARIDRELKL